MQIIELSVFWTIAADIIAWAVFHLGISFVMLNVPDDFFLKRNSWFRPRKWEKEGQIWQDIFRVQSWKRHLPDGTLFFKDGYNQSHLQGTELDSLEQFILETKRAEMTHWLSILPAGLFFLWNPPWAGWVMVGYAVLFNVPFIVAQRYNRPRIERLYQRKKKRRSKNG